MFLPTVFVFTVERGSVLHPKLFCITIIRSNSMASFDSPDKIKLVYFDLPAKAEPIRLAFYLGGIVFEDERVTGADWQTMKTKYGPYAQIPVLEVDGKVLYQSVNILLYAGRLSKLLPDDLEGELKMREAILFCDDIPNTFSSTFSITNVEERITARNILFKEGGRTYCQLKRIEELVRGKEYVAGNRLTVADLAIFTYCSMLQCGHFDGFPRDCLDCVPEIKKFCNRIAMIPAVAEYYNKQSGAWVAGFKPQP